MQHRYHVLFHTGDNWGRGCASSVAFEVFGSQGRLLSSQCAKKEVAPVTWNRAQVASRHAAARAPRGAAGGGEAGAGRGADTSPPGRLLEPRRNVFALFSKWLLSSGGGAQLKALLQSVDGSADGVLSMEEVKQLLAKAIPRVSDLETQLFSAMVDVNGDGVISEEELRQSLADCADIDSAVVGGGNPGLATSATSGSPVGVGAVATAAAAVAGSSAQSSSGAAPPPGGGGSSG
ncbi:hypothetical protein Agub_g5401, partial [Astrephomene gubernaculifera]